MYQPQGSLQTALEGSYELPFKQIIREAWTATSGAKFTFFIGYLIVLAIMLASSFLSETVFTMTIQEMDGEDMGGVIALKFVIDVLLALIQIPLYASLMFMGIRYTNGGSLTPGDIFNGFGRFWRLVGSYLLMYLLVIIGLLLLILPGIYLAIAYIFVYPLILEKDMGIWEAMETSRKAVSKHWFLIVGLMLGMSVILVLSAIPLGIGLIWTIPMAYIFTGILYSRIFGIEPQTIEETMIYHKEEE